MRNPRNSAFISNSFADYSRIEQFQRIVKSPLDSWETFPPGGFAVLPYAQIDMSVFTLGTHEDDVLQTVCQPLTDLYQSVMQFATRASSAKATQDNQHLTRSIRAHMPIEPSDHDQEPDPNDSRIPALNQARQLLNLSTLVSEPEPCLAQAVAHLKHLLHQTDVDGFWGPLPGALIWCLVIGARLSQPGSARKWFMMQIQRTCCAMAQDGCDMVLRCLQTVLVGLDGAHIDRLDICLMSYG